MKRHLVRSEVYAVFLCELIRHEIHQSVVEVVAAQMGIAVCRFYFKYAVAQFKNRYIECTAAQVEYEDFPVAALIEAVCKSRRRRFIDYAENVKAGNLTRILDGLTLAIGKVCQHGNNCLRYFFAQIRFSIFFQFLQDHC